MNEPRLAELPDEEIVLRALILQSDFAIIIERYQEKLLRYIKRLGIHQNQDAEDVLQDVFLKCYRNLNSFDTSLTFSSWIYRIAHNEAINFFRKNSRRPQGYYVSDNEEALKRIQADGDTTWSTEQQINSEYLNEALNKLSQKYRDIIILRYFEEREYLEISDILKIPTGSVATNLHRAKKALRKHLKQFEEKTV
ncbi:hypothetical protein COY25_01610 [Candidatus Uhrbacteria bacterium CG_4_10_14_0_2_um_filter_41_7]|uniref:RNA polymerase sigma factor n=1 Tax=Candidatus Uhrbacteria bacterium CG_4_9_14_3_um_filter_41_35 TaxID=1975034 RepID=A0A2M7XDA0_9BACT|nr:MAG: hypothetical protein COV92_04075 [Candidatus Uhrbacteria bacterium CG11_big_fil_rev_8_21_14_0_20_41_9]PIZ54882.1 MAG: hypothetical protein COY25_01610 [Candidatus Uhrbacteria bacterium CG_4_10_14_0_2_um_filter_41_7]PJA45802.1 MAG: hypothetical protein CO173_04495 [Candidatus Uhrbacteria bacterium CG_4_9_14_3_um_filter_41_35]